MIKFENLKQAWKCWRSWFANADADESATVREGDILGLDCSSSGSRSGNSYTVTVNGVSRTYSWDEPQLSDEEVAARIASLMGGDRPIISTSVRSECEMCDFYHGRTWERQRLVCAVHPCGYQGDEEKCPDYLPYTTPIAVRRYLSEED